MAGDGRTRWEHGLIDTQGALTQVIQQDVGRLAFWLVMGWAIGWTLGHPLTGLFVGLVVFLWFQWYALYQLYRWIRFFPETPPPQLKGIWAALAYNVHRLQISERRARQSLVNTIERARASVSALSEAVVLINGIGQLEWWNPAAEGLLGLKAGDRGNFLLNLIRHPSFVQYFESGNYEEALKLESWVQSGCHLQCELTRFGQNDRLLIVYDVTRLHRLEQIRKDFVANVSHELRTPLTVLSGYLETFLDQDDLNLRWRRGFGQMQQQTRRMTHLVNDLLLLSRLENEAVNPTTRIDMPALVAQIFSDAEAYNAEQGHSLHLQIDSHAGLHGCEQDVASALSNLVTNAIKYTPAGGTVDLRWFVNDAGEGVFEVTDSGIGIDPDHLPRLTERFYRVDSGRSRATGGTGLGLAIVKHVLMQHGGRLRVTSVPGQGSTFQAIFPACRILFGSTPDYSAKPL